MDIASIATNNSASTICQSIKTAQGKYVGAFIVAIDNTPVFTTKDVDRIFKEIHNNDNDTFQICVAPENYHPNVKLPVCILRLITRNYSR